MNYEALFGKENKIVQVGIAGIGDFGKSLLKRSKKVVGFGITLICDKDSQQMEKTLSDYGMSN